MSKRSEEEHIRVGGFGEEAECEAEQRAEESKKPGERLDVDYLGVTQEIGAVSQRE